MSHRRTGRRTQQRLYDWREGVTDITTTANATQRDVTLLGPVGTQERATITRIVGSVSVTYESTGVVAAMTATGQFDSVIHMGIQVVNRAKGVPGSARNPATLSDREGKEWMWLRSYRRSALIANMVIGASDLAPWWIPLDATGSDDTRVDIKVKRRIDLSEDELLLSITQFNLLASGSMSAITFRVQSDLRVLLQV